MFAIPAGIWFATAQMTTMKTISSFIYTKNFIVLMTVLSMIFIMILNVHGQRNTLNQVKEEYLDIFDELEKFEDVDAEIRTIKVK